MTVSAHVPEEVDILEITRALEENLGTKVDVNLVPTRNPSVTSVTYWWRTATHGMMRGREAFQFVQLQIEFDNTQELMQIDFLCLPEIQKGTGKGRAVVDTIKRVGQRLGYKKIVIDSIEGSYMFWLRVNFIPTDPFRTSFPRHMVHSL